MAEEKSVMTPITESKPKNQEAIDALTKPKDRVEEHIISQSGLFGTFMAIASFLLMLVNGIGLPFALIASLVIFFLALCWSHDIISFFSSSDRLTMSRLEELYFMASRRRLQLQAQQPSPMVLAAIADLDLEITILEGQLRQVYARSTTNRSTTVASSLTDIETIRTELANALPPMCVLPLPSSKGDDLTEKTQ